MQPRKLDLILSTQPNITLSSPKLRQRLLMIQVTFTGHIQGEKIALRFQSPQGQQYGAVVSGPIEMAGGTVFFTIGGASPGNGTAAATDAYQGGPLPWFWWTPNLALNLSIDNASGGVTATNWVITREVAEMVDDGKPGD